MTKSSEFSLSETGAEAGINALFRAAQTCGAAFSAWRLPNQEELFISICFGAETISENFALEKAPSGFIMHPFASAPQNQAWFMPSGLLFISNLQQNTITGRQLTENPKATQFRETLRQELEAPSGTSWYASSAEIKATNRAAFEDLVKNAISFLKKGEAEKVVPSRCANVSLPLHFTPVTGFLSLLKKYPQAFVSLVSAPETGTWLGASPEILVQKDQQNIFRTMALAGTQKVVSGQNQADAIWRQKEIEEQSLVVRYIISCFKKIRLREYIETGPRTVAAGNLLHLRSDFCVDLNEQTDFPDLTTQMLHLLHPTSAVCGQPKETALTFLNAHENYDRRYYSGYLGPVNQNEETAIFVNLRCLELRENTAVLYAGAGVTPDSDPAREWQETELKMQTVSAALQILTPPDDTATGY